ncbi:hypothetical protein CkaCkLH20_00025 [Colletotrichum karsti]|uniref:DUF7730 domain-containing protein n=1 Tax=Colletotrichum karsti TaxID=1095194 RepID=A0A9P6IFP2_9PEZI|nr:uncharacterized protein CkaCkLH20_00025 [Colletotrichum karsti]KAF9881989.1 hypothetical protein CkaCkLH20_00025 [Colletotrichum karsti]
MRPRPTADSQPSAAARCEQPSDPQEQSPFFRLPWEVRNDIYNIAFPRIVSPQLIYADVDGKLSFNEIGTATSGNQRLRRIVCNGVFEDHGTEITGRRRAARNHEDGDNSPYAKSLREMYHRSPDELLCPLPLLLACRRMYEDVAPHCDQSLAFQDFLTLELFFAKVSDGVLASGLLDRMNKVSLDIKFTHDGAFKPSSRKKILASWSAACKRLASLRSMQNFRVRLEIPLSQQSSVPGNVHVAMIKELASVAAHVPEVEVQLMLTSVVHPKSERIWSYRPGKPRNNRGFQVPGWTERIEEWGSFTKLDEEPPHLRT